MSHLKLFFLGSPRLEQDGNPLELSTQKSMALLAYLAVTGQVHRREALTTLLWPKSRPRQARSILRTTLWTLNKNLADDKLLVERDRVGLNQEADIWLDVDHFRRLAQSWETHDHPDSEVCDHCLAQLAEATTLYQGDFLAGFTLRDSANFDDWQAFETEQLRRELAGALERLVDGHRQQGRFDTAISYAQRWLALDTLHEPAHRQLMQLYAESGNRSAALRQYQSCYELLEDELEVRPEAETTALYERIRQETAQHVKIVAGHYGIVDGDTPQGLAKSLLGQGGMGNVYRGLDTQSGDPVAIKILKPEIVASNPGIVERFVREGEALLVLDEHPNGVTIAAWNKNESLILTAGIDGTAKIWDAETGELLRTFSGHTAPIWNAAWNRDESQIVTVGEAGFLRTWNATTGAELMAIQDNRALQLANWNQDEDRILAAGIQGVRQYFTRLEDLIAVACDRVTRNLTHAEWQQLMGDQSYRATCSDLPVPEE